MAVIGGLSWLALRLDDLLFGGPDWHWLFWLIYLAVFAFTLGRWLGGWIFGWYLLLTCRYCDMNHNDAFSAMRLDSHRHFLRIRILGDKLTVFPIKIDRVPSRHDWRENPERETDRLASVFISQPPMQPGLIEPPIEIKARQAPSTSEVKTPSQLPTGQ
jgi:hypothetical protein